MNGREVTSEVERRSGNNVDAIVLGEVYLEFAAQVRHEQEQIGTAVGHSWRRGGGPLKRRRNAVALWSKGDATKGCRKTLFKGCGNHGCTRRGGRGDGEHHTGGRAEWFWEHDPTSLFGNADEVDVGEAKATGVLVDEQSTHAEVGNGFPAARGSARVSVEGNVASVEVCGCAPVAQDLCDGAAQFLLVVRERKVHG